MLSSLSRRKAHGVVGECRADSRRDWRYLIPRHVSWLVRCVCLSAPACFFPVGYRINQRRMNQEALEPEILFCLFCSRMPEAKRQHADVNTLTSFFFISEVGDLHGRRIHSHTNATGGGSKTRFKREGLGPPLSSRLGTKTLSSPLRLRLVAGRRYSSKRSSSHDLTCTTHPN